MEREKVDYLAKVITDFTDMLKEFLEMKYNCKIKMEIRVSVDDPELKKEG